MTDTTSRLSLPLIVPGQAQKEMFHNESLLRLDALVAAVVEDGPLNAPPSAPTAGQSYIVGASPSGDWLGQANQIAAYDSYGWRFLNPVEGCKLWLKSRGVHAQFVGGAWVIGMVPADRFTVGGQQVVGARAAAIADPVGGATVDAQSRTAIAAILSALRNHGLVAG